MFDSKDKEFEIDNSKYDDKSVDNMEEYTEEYNGSHQDFFGEEKRILNENEQETTAFSVENETEVKANAETEKSSTEELQVEDRIQNDEIVQDSVTDESKKEISDKEKDLEVTEEVTSSSEEVADEQVSTEIEEPTINNKVEDLEEKNLQSPIDVSSPIDEQQLVVEKNSEEQFQNIQTEEQEYESENHEVSRARSSYYVDSQEDNQYDVGNESDELSDVDSSIDLEEYGEDVQVFAVAPKFVPDDPRVPTTIQKAVGTISQFGPTVGGVDLEFTSTASGIDERYKFQGKAKAAFVLTGGVLDANVTISVLESFDENSMKYKYAKKTQPPVSIYITDTLRNFLIKAANETIDDINGIRTTTTSLEYGVSAPIGVPNITHRAHLIRALRKVFASNSGETDKVKKTTKAEALKFTFKDLDETTPKQVTIVYNGQAMFPTSVDYARNMIVEDSLVNNLDLNPKAKTTNVENNSRTSNVNFDASRIAINFDIKSGNVARGLKTNTNYEFAALNKNLTFFRDCVSATATGTGINFLEGFTLSNFKTGRKPPLFETLWVSSATGSMTLQPSALITLLPLASSDKLSSSIDFNSINKTTFLDYYNLLAPNAQSYALKISGASIKLNTLKIYDTDSTITKIEVEDDRANKYPVSLIPIDDSDKSKGANPQINGLQRSTPYHFKKLHVTAQPEDTSVTETFIFSMFSSSPSGSAGGSNVTANPNHNILLRTSSFHEPVLFIESTPIFVSVADGTTSTIASSSFTLPAFLPKFDVLLPNKVKMPAVSNDKTSLRYVIEVDNSDGRAGELTVNGLKGDENYKVQKFVGKDKNFYVVNLYNLSEKRDYGFLIFELSYKDLDGRELIARKVLSEINRVVSVTTTSGTTTTIQFPNYDLDNTTGPERTGTAAFNVTLFEQTLVEARRAEIPVFIDDMNSSFLRLEFRKPENNPNVEVKLENGILKFSNLEPKTEVVYKLDFIWKDKDGQEKTLSKYAKIVTPDVQVVDVMSTSITTDQSSATIVFKLYSQPKLPIVSVSLNDDKYKYSWDKDKLELVITGLRPKTEYRDIEVTFKLENGLTAKHKLDVFTTKEEVAPPKGKVADFVAKIYRIALNREPEINGWRFWVSKLESKEISVGQFINDLMVQDEFIDRFLSKEDFIKMMYQIVLGREPEEEGKNYWMGKYDEYKTQEDSLINLRMRIASEMMNEKEFKEYVSSMGLRY